MGAPFRVPPCNDFWGRLMHRFWDILYRIPLSTHLSPRVVAYLSVGTCILVSGNGESDIRKKKPASRWRDLRAESTPYQPSKMQTVTG